MRPVLVSYSDAEGGAARAAYRLHRALLQYGHSSRMKVRVKKTDDWTVDAPTSVLGDVWHTLRSRTANLMLRAEACPTPGPRSGNFLPSRWASSLAEPDADIVNLHWVGAETMAIEDIGRIRKPVVWTLHDMWPFCGSEHYAEDSPHARWRQGYDVARPKLSVFRPDIARWIWTRKRRSLHHADRVVAPSRWLAQCARDSALMKDSRVDVIPNVVDTEIYKPIDRAFSRQVLNLDLDRRVVLFGAIKGIADPRKGWDLLDAALRSFAASRSDHETIECVVFGQTEPRSSASYPFPMRWQGQVQDDATLALLYSAADVTIVPSRQENLPQTATEAASCGCPVVGFSCTGMSDAVLHGETGYLAAPYDSNDLARGIAWILESEERRRSLSAAARRRAVELWSAGVVTALYARVYEEASASARR